MVKNKFSLDLLKLTRGVAFGLFTFFFFFFLASGSLACDVAVSKLSVCFNSRMPEGNSSCYTGNWRVRGAIFNVGSTNSLSWYYIYDDSMHYWKSSITKVLTSGQRWDTNDTITKKLCGRVVLNGNCSSSGNYDSYWDNNTLYSVLAKNIPHCFPTLIR